MEFIKNNYKDLLITGGLLALGSTLFFFGMFYNKIYLEVGTYIVQDLNNGASLEKYSYFIKSFASGGYIEPIPSGIAMMLTVLGVASMYLSAYSWINRKSDECWYQILTIEYWSTFFLLRKQKTTLSAEAIESIRKAKEIESRVKAIQIQSSAKDIEEKRIKRAKKREALQNLKKKGD